MGCTGYALDLVVMVQVLHMKSDVYTWTDLPGFLQVLTDTPVLVQALVYSSEVVSILVLYSEKSYSGHEPHLHLSVHVSDRHSHACVNLLDNVILWLDNEYLCCRLAATEFELMDDREHWTHLGVHVLYQRAYEQFLWSNRKDQLHYMDR